jgi:hypothetical protein
MLLQGRHAEAEAALVRMVALAERHGFEGRIAHGMLWRGVARLALGRSAEGLTDVREGFARWVAVGGRTNPTVYSAEVAAPLIETGHHDAAEEFLLIGERALREADERIGQADLLRLRGALLLARGSAADAEAKLREALHIAEAQGARLFALRASTDLALLLHASRRRDEGRALLGRIHRSVTEGLQTPDVRRAAAALATLDGEQ